jgi:hypothetical protein
MEIDMQKNITPVAIYKTLLAMGDQISCAERALLYNFRLIDACDQDFVSGVTRDLAAPTLATRH